MSFVAQKKRSRSESTHTNLAEFFRRNQNDEDERSVGNPPSTIFGLSNIIIVVVAVKAVPAALCRIAATVAVLVVVVVIAVRVVDRVTDGLRRLAVPTVEQALLAVARTVTDAVLEQIVAVDALSDGRTVAI